ncbi:hypothetical protein ACEOVL_21345 [Pseudomonas aeruginosa]
MTESKICTCPSGDGSLRWPCPKHPAEDQAAHWRERGCEVSKDELMTVSQHERIVGALRAENAKLSEALDRWPLIRDSLKLRLSDALARVAELEAALSSALSQHGIKFMDPPDGGDTPLIEQVCRMSQALAELEKQESVAWVEVIDRDYGPYKFYGKRLLPKGKHQLYAAPVAQAQHSVPEVSGIGRDFAYPRSVVLYLRTEPTDDDLRAIHDGLRSLAAAPGKEVPQAWLDVQAERRRQVEAEGWTPEHDDLYCAAELPRAAAAYILNGANDEAPAIWPFSAKWWKPRDARSNYVRASALILAEIERLDRAAPGKEGNDD